MSLNYCQEATGPSIQLGKAGAGFKSTGATSLETRNSTDAGLVTLAGATPTADDHFTTREYVNDLVALNITWKEAALVCATTNIVISGPGATIDGVAMSVGDRVVLKGQTVPVQNAVMVWEGAAVAMTFPADWLSGSEQSGSVISIREGTCEDELYIASADPGVVGTDDPEFLLIGSTAAGVSSVLDAAAVPVGGSSFIASGGTGAVTMNVLDDSARISVSLAADIITLDIVALSIDTAQLADGGVTIAKIDALATIASLRLAIVFGDQGTTVSFASALPTDSLVIGATVDVTTLFDEAGTDFDVRVNGVSVSGPAANDPNLVNVYECTGLNEANAGAITPDVVVGGTVNTTGAAVVTIYYQVTVV